MHQPLPFFSLFDPFSQGSLWLLMFLDCQLPAKWSLTSSPEWDFHSSAPQDICHSAKAGSGPREGMMSCLGMLGEQEREELSFGLEPEQNQPPLMAFALFLIP